MVKSDAWKATEKAIAQRLGGKRTSHRNLGGGGPDVRAGAYVVETKERASLPMWLTGAMAQAERYVIVGQLALLVLHQLGERHDRDLVVMRLKDFEEWFGGTNDGVS